MRKLANFSFSFAAACLLISLMSEKAEPVVFAAVVAAAAAAAFICRNKRLRVLLCGFAFGTAWCICYKVFLSDMAGTFTAHLSAVMPGADAITGAAEKLFDAQTCAFIKALLAGDRTDFFQNASLSTVFRRSGISHLVAVSGMHVSFLVNLVRMLTGKSVRSSFLCITCVWFFVFMSGASPSALRAAVMQTVLLLAPVVKRENDTITSLGFALMLLLIADPPSVLSASLQLSFAAVLGISLFSERLEAALSRCFGRLSMRKPVKYLTGTVATSVAVMVFTVPLTAIHFGSVQLLSPLTNILVLWCVSFCFIGAAGCIGLSFLSLPAAQIAAKAVSLAVDYITGCAQAVSACRFSNVYVCADYAVMWVIGVYLVFYLFSRIGPLGKRLLPAARGLIPFGISIAALGLLSFGTKQYYASQPGFFTAVSVGQGQCISVLSGGATVMIDCGSTFTAENAGEKAGEYLLSRGRERVDMLVVTHLHNDHVNGIPVLLEMLPVEKIVISAYVPDDDGLLQEIEAAASAHGCDLIRCKESAEVQCGEVLLDLYMPHAGRDDNETCMFVRASVGDADMLITGDAPASAEMEYIARHGVSGIDVLIAGHHGSKTSSSGELIARCMDAACIISTGQNPYGHPAAETLERLSVLPAVYRTDKDGTVQIALSNG